MGTEKINFKFQRNLGNTGKIIMRKISFNFLMDSTLKFSTVV